MGLDGLDGSLTEGSCCAWLQVDEHHIIYWHEAFIELCTQFSDPYFYQSLVGGL